MAGSDIKFKSYKGIDDAMNDGKGTMVFDNEPRNKEIITRMEKVIDKGWNICIWPSTIKKKDLNDMYLSGISDLSEIINKNTYKSLLAKTHLVEWRKK